MWYRSLISVAATILLVVVARPVTASAHGCQPGSGEVAQETTSFYNNDKLLGPDPLPHGAPVGPMLVGYTRFGTVPDETEWGKQFVTGKSDNPFNWPPDPPYADGFDVRPGTTTPDVTKTLLPVGRRLDRFGYPGGRFLAAKGASFPSRALPPQYLVTPADAPQSNYHIYCVVQAFSVDAGPVAPWFGQPGHATQYVLRPNYLNPPPNEAFFTVLWLLDPQHQYLVEERP